MIEFYQDGDKESFPDEKPSRFDWETENEPAELAKSLHNNEIERQVRQMVTLSVDEESLIKRLVKFIEMIFEEEGK